LVFIKFSFCFQKNANNFADFANQVLKLSH